MPPKKFISMEKIILINVANIICLKNKLSLKLKLPFIYERFFNEKISYSTISKYIRPDSYNITEYQDIVAKS